MNCTPTPYKVIRIAPFSTFKLRAEDQYIIDAVCIYFQITPEVLKSKLRTREVSEVRFMTCYLLRKYSCLTFKRVGHIFNRDHSTAMNAVHCHKDLYDYDLAYRTKFNGLFKTLKFRFNKAVN